MSWHLGGINNSTSTLIQSVYLDIMICVLILNVDYILDDQFNVRTQSTTWNVA